MDRITLPIKELQQAGVPEWCAKMTANSILSLYKRKDGKSPYWWLKFEVPEPLQAQLGTRKRGSTKQTDKRLARKEASRLIAEWCAPLLPPDGVSAAPADEPPNPNDLPPELPLRPVTLTHELIEELCRARRDATMWSAEDDMNGVSSEGLKDEGEPTGEVSGVSSDDERTMDGDLPAGVFTLSEHFSEWEPRFRSVIERGRSSADFRAVADEAVDFAAVLGYRVSTNDPSFVAFVRNFAISEMRSHKAIQGAREGDVTEAVGFAGVPPAAGSHKLGYLLEQWQANRTRHLKPGTAKLYATRFRNFIEHVHDIPCRVVTSFHVTRFLEDVVYGGHLTEKTANAGYLPALRAVFKYGVSLQLIDQDPMPDISKPRLSRAEREAQTNKRAPFSTDELNVLFASRWYADESRNLGRSAAVVGHARYWVPLIELCQNLRPEEACQLGVTDVAVIDGTHALRVEEVIALKSDDDGRRPLERVKSVKSEASERWIPVHQKLLDLGWADFVASRKNATAEGWLFPELRRGKNNSDAFNKRFNDFLHERLNLKLVQYGLRHTWEDERRRAQARASSTQGAWPPGMFFAIAGRASTEEEEGSAANYGEGYDIDDVKYFLDQLLFEGVKWPIAWPDWANLYGPSND
ncbi:hypothetical protein [Trinickia mobilis]|uniref:hypothetical protein n=1 Tax=Trinickia mobilis TaxID=2816356 RepID=UPI001A8DBE80|nr:hypothetical protein [Trinickia mobilis]